MRAIETWIDLQLDVTDEIPELRIIPTIGGWRAEIVNDRGRAMLSNTARDQLMSEFGTTLDQAVERLNRLAMANLQLTLPA